MDMISFKTERGNRANPSDQYQISRRDFLKLSIAVIGGLGVPMAGCSPDDSVVEGFEGYLKVIDEWIVAVNTDAVTQFEQLHTETVLYNSSLQPKPYNGRQNIWDAFRLSNAGPIEKIHMFGQDDLICLQVTSTETKRSFLFVFSFDGDLIANVYEYSGDYDLSVVPLFDGVDITTDNTDLPKRIDTIDSQVGAHNDRDFSRFIETFNDDAILYVPLAKNPVIGIESIKNDVQGFTQFFPNVELSIYRTFGQGNLVCQQLSVNNGPMKSVGFVNVFEGGKVSRVYEYLSKAELIS